MALIAPRYADPRVGGVMIGLGALLSFWSAGLLALGVRAFPTTPLRWAVPIRVAEGAAVWFASAPLVLGPRAVLPTGPAVSALLLAWAAFEYLTIARRTRYAGALLMAGSIQLVAVSNVIATVLTANLAGQGTAFNRLLVFNVVANIFVALGMHLVVFEEMTDEFRRANRDLASANEEVRWLARTDPLTGCHNRHFFDQIER